MTAVFADTFYWVALTDPGDSLFEQAATIEAQLGEISILTTDEVLGEFLTFFSSHPWLRRRAVRTVRALSTDPRVRVLPQSRASYEQGFELYAARSDKQYSFTDCISMTTMRREGISDVLTNDRHFEQEGFRVLFREDS